MENLHKVNITDRDRLMNAWQNSMDLVRSFEAYSKEVEKYKYAEIFAEYAEDEGIHASHFRELLEEIDKQ